MKKEFENALSTAAKNTGLTLQQTFDAGVKSAMLDIVEYMVSDENAQFDIVNLDRLFWEPDWDIKTYNEVAVIKCLMQRAMVVSEPFDDVIGSYYENRFLEPRNPLDQLATPERVKLLVARLGNDNDKRPEIVQFPDFDCRTGTQTMSFMKQIFSEYGKINY